MPWLYVSWCGASSPPQRPAVQCSRSVSCPDHLLPCASYGWPCRADVHEDNACGVCPLVYCKPDRIGHGAWCTVSGHRRVCNSEHIGGYWHPCQSRSHLAAHPTPLAPGGVAGSFTTDLGGQPWLRHPCPFAPLYAEACPKPSPVWLFVCLPSTWQNRC